MINFALLVCILWHGYNITIPEKLALKLDFCYAVEYNESAEYNSVQMALPITLLVWIIFLTEIR